VDLCSPESTPSVLHSTEWVNGPLLSRVHSHDPLSHMAGEWTPHGPTLGGGRVLLPRSHDTTERVSGPPRPHISGGRVRTPDLCQVLPVGGPLHATKCACVPPGEITKTAVVAHPSVPLCGG